MLVISSSEELPLCETISSTKSDSPSVQIHKVLNWVAVYLKSLTSMIFAVMKL